MGLQTSSLFLSDTSSSSTSPKPGLFAAPSGMAPGGGGSLRLLGTVLYVIPVGTGLAEYCHRARHACQVHLCSSSWMIFTFFIYIFNTLLPSSIRSWRSMTSDSFRR
jgi:hypothetical protein